MRKIFLLGLLTCSLISGFSQSSPTQWGVDESRHVPVGLNEGEKAPNFNVNDVNGDEIELQELLTKGKVVLLFYRGQWCPVCNRYLSQFQDEVSQILDKGATVIAVTPETTDNAVKMINKTDMTFNVVADSEGKIMKDYDVLFHVTTKYNRKISMALLTDIAKNNGNDEALLPVPATYIINQNGNIDKVFFDYNYKKRPSVSEIIQFL